jgi:hypothetical protein
MQQAKGVLSKSMNGNGYFFHASPASVEKEIASLAQGKPRQSHVLIGCQRGKQCGGMSKLLTRMELNPWGLQFD